jgi:hypothetical protein
MVLIFTHTTSKRLQYICDFIFKTILKVDYKITIDSEELKYYDGISINYSNTKFDNVSFHISNHNLLLANDIKPQQINCFNYKDVIAFFKIDNCDFGFDIFAASFYLLSRYEEYLPHTKDMYGRYAHENSIAFKVDFLQLPLINIWINEFAKALKNKFPNQSFGNSTFEFLPTYDIDIAYSYKHKGIVRNIGGFLKQPNVERIKVQLGLQPDPFDSYTWLDELHKKHNLTATYFFLLAEKKSTYDKNIALHKNAMWRLIKTHAVNYELGIHPSWQSAGNIAILKKEKSYLEAMSEIEEITKSRQHFIKFNLPNGYRQLIEAGIKDDYSMGYGSINGFRASVASSFYWFDLEKNETTDLLIHPFCFMDANCYYEQKQTAEQGFDELMHYYNICKENNATLITIFHNNFLGTAKEFKGWREMYEKFIEALDNGL